MRRIFFSTLILSFSLVLSGCLAQPSPLGPTPEIPTVQLEDGASYTLTAKQLKKNLAGKELNLLAYNGSIPGPTIKVRQGSTIFLTLDNQIDMPTLLHSHGVRLKNAFDGTDMTQKEIPAGGSFRYEITFPDPGVYWYHPHLREDYQQDLGLYGTFIVEAEDKNYWSPVNREEILVLDDLLLANGDLVPYGRNAADHALMGRYGNTMLVNGTKDFGLEVKKGELVRFYLLNASNARPYNFTLDGLSIKLVGGDNGKHEQETFVDHVTLSPSERAVIEVLFSETGNFSLLNRIPQGDRVLGSIMVIPETAEKNYSEAFAELKKNDEITHDIDRYRNFFDIPPDKELKVGIDMMGMSMGHMGMMGGMVGGDNPIEWEDDLQHMNAQSTSSMITWKLIDAMTDKENTDIDWSFKKGDLVKIRIFNDPKIDHPMQHPIHIHGQRFLVLATNGEKHSNLVWKDTVLVPAGDTIDILVEMSNPGTWMLHCHIPEHLESKMAMNFKIL